MNLSERNTKAARRITWRGYATPDGWVDVSLECGHGLKILLGWPNGHASLPMDHKIICAPCLRVSLPGFLSP